jgi:hypothetical protein
MHCVDQVWRIDAALRSLHPQAVALLEVANEQAWKAISPTLLEQLRLRIGALVEMCLDITKWSVQKIYVSLGSDAADFLPKNAQGTSFFSFDKHGKVAGFAAQ